MDFNTVNIIQFAKDFEQRSNTAEIRAANFRLHQILLSCMKRGTKERAHKEAEMQKVFEYAQNPTGVPPALHNCLGAMTHGGLAWNVVAALIKYTNMPEANANALVVNEYGKS